MHILHSLNPDGFEKSSEGECAGTMGRNNSNNVSKQKKYKFLLRNKKNILTESCSLLATEFLGSEKRSWRQKYCYLTTYSKIHN